MVDPINGMSCHVIDVREGQSKFIVWWMRGGCANGEPVLERGIGNKVSCSSRL
jgi:hypothetical protein